jgi:hypothetical protein
MFHEPVQLVGDIGQRVALRSLIGVSRSPARICCSERLIRTADR